VTRPRPSRISLAGVLIAVTGGILILVAIASRIWYAVETDRTLTLLVGIAGLAAVILGSTLIAVHGFHAHLRAFAHGAAFGADLANGSPDE
jgi:Co/Zn/Cd efflux system component